MRYLILGLISVGNPPLVIQTFGISIYFLGIDIRNYIFFHLIGFNGYFARSKIKQCLQFS